MKRIKVKALVEIEIDIPEDLAEYYLKDKKINLSGELSEDHKKECFKVGCFEDSDLSERLGNIKKDKIQIVSHEVYEEKDDE